MKISSRKKKAKFFCESCGAEVSQNAKVCTKCGKFFASVRCPRCAHTGSTEEFTHGCPECGYAVRKSKNIKTSGNSQFNSIFNSIFGTSYNSSAEVNSTGDGSLPFWVYLISLACLGITVFGVFSCLAHN